MKALTLTLRPLTPFGTPPAGDTLFGQLCWALALRHGESALERALQGYTEGHPFAVLSDAFPAGWLPRPTLPDHAAGLPEVDPKQRKAWRRRQWLPAAGVHQPVAQWLQAPRDEKIPWAREAMRTQNSINRLTGTTGHGQFAPRQVGQIAFEPQARLEVHVVHDPERLGADELRALVADIGATGFGRDASTGLGKFEIERVAERPAGKGTRHAMTLAPCAFDPGSIDAQGSWWLPLTRFGRHGGTAALGMGGGPFKRPILLARTGAVLRWREPQAPLFHGRGLGGAATPISAVIPGTVHQGYAPLQPIVLGEDAA